MDSGTYQPIIPNCIPSSYPSGRFSLIVLRTALSAARRSAGSAARYWATVEAVMLATIHGSERQKEELRFKKSEIEGQNGESDSPSPYACLTITAQLKLMHRERLMMRSRCRSSARITNR